MSNPSISDSLFHFTSVKGSTRGAFNEDEESFNILKSILRSRSFLMPKHNRSIKNVQGQTLTSPVNMACFTETPLSFVSGHMSVFGRFGIGVSFQWAKRVRAQNVVYIDEEHHTPFVEAAVGLFTSHMASFSKLAGKNQTMFTPGDGLFEMVPDPRYLTFIVGSTEQFCFRHEREWRVIGAAPNGQAIYTETFDYSEIDCLICPQSYLPSLVSFVTKDLGAASFGNFMSSESLQKS